MSNNDGPAADGAAGGAGEAVADGQRLSDTTSHESAPASSLILPRRKQILTPEDHATTLHGSGRGRVTIAQQLDGRWLMVARL